MSAAECDHLETVSFISQQSQQSGFGDDLVSLVIKLRQASFCLNPDCFDDEGNTLLAVLGGQKQALLSTTLPRANLS